MARRAPRVETGAGQSLRQQRITVGIVLLVIGALVTVGTYTLASSSPSGGTYFIAFGPVIFGIYLIARGIATPAGIPALTRPKRTSNVVPVPPVTESDASTASNARSVRATTRMTKWPLRLFLLGLLLFLVGEAISLTNFAASQAVGDALGIPGFLLLIITPIWWAVAWVRRRVRTGPV